MNKKLYEAPASELLLFSEQDIISGSNLETDNDLL